MLPADKTVSYLKNEVNILGFANPPADYNQLVAQAGNTDGKTKIIHVVQAGEFTHKIAMMYNVTLENIKAWNHLSRKRGKCRTETGYLGGRRGISSAVLQFCSLAVA